MPSHEAYNIKGSISAFRNVTKDEKSACDRLRKEVYGFYAELGIPEHLADRYWLKEPDIAVRFAVDKIFVQTLAQMQVNKFINLDKLYDKRKPPPGSSRHVPKLDNNGFW